MAFFGAGGGLALFVGDMDSGIQASHSAGTPDWEVQAHAGGKGSLCAKLLKLSKAKCKVLRKGQASPNLKLGGEWRGSSPEQKKLGMLELHDL